MVRSLLAAAVLALLAGAAGAQTLVLAGPDGRTATLNAAELAALPRQSVSFAAHGESHVYEGPMLIDVLAKAGAPTGKALHGAEMADVVLVEAADGYTVAFGLAEADPGTRPNRIILADRVDGGPLGAKDGPFKVVVEGDLRPARSARRVERISIVRLAKAGARPSP